MQQSDLQRIEKIPMNFVMGRERSGTTLLQVMLNSQPEIVAPSEARFIMLWYTRYGSVKQWTEKLIRKYVEDIYTERLFKNFWGVDKERLLADLLSVKEQLNYPLVCKIVYSHVIPEGKDIKVFIDKNPLYYNFLPVLDKLFPEAKYIHIVRDYRDNIVSHKKVYLTRETAFIAYHWVSINKLIETAKSKNAAKWITLSYEGLVANPAETVEKICKHLGVRFDATMVQQTPQVFKSFTENKDNDRLNLFHANLFKPISDAHIGHWQKSLTPDDIKAAEAVAGEYAETIYGYKRSLEKATISSFRLFKAKMKYTFFSNGIRMAVASPWVYSTVRAFWLKFIRNQITSKSSD